MFAPRHVRRIVPFAASLALILLLAAPRAHAQTWNETGDAGDLVSTAQATIGSGALLQINGNLQSPDDVDLYCVDLPAVPPSGLPLVQLNCVVIQGPNVYLFDANGFGVYTNETCSAGEKTILAPPTGLPAGTYYVAVANYGLEPVSAGGLMWNVGVPVQRQPDGPGQTGSLIGWTGSPIVNPLNPYQVRLAGLNYCDAATPTLRSTWGTLKSHYR